MYESLLALHSVDQCNQEFITADDVYEASIHARLKLLAKTV